MRRLFVNILLLTIVGAAHGEVVQVDPPLSADVFLRSGPAARVSGELLRYDAQTLVIRTRSDERELKWLELTPQSAFVLRSRVIDREKASDWLALGEMGWSMGARDQARTALARAVKLDPSLKGRANEILATAAGSAVAAQPSKPSTTPAPTTRPSYYIASTPEQDAAAIERAQQFSAAVADKLEITFTELQTPHFIVFTDWDPREFDFIKSNVEAAYAAVARQFEVPAKENIFVGKLPIFMFGRQEDFQTFSAEFHEMAPTPTLLGYYAEYGNGRGHMAMWKPNVAAARGNLRQAERQWAYVLTHEFAHAFIARYHSHRPIPRWLNEGLAEVIAQRQFPDPQRRIQARQQALARYDFTFLFDDDNMPGGEFYPVMHTMTEMLLVQDPRRFLEMFRAIKDGMEGQAALTKFYGVDHEQLIAAWRQYATRR
jgi:hypothetical protein